MTVDIRMRTSVVDALSKCIGKAKAVVSSRLAFDTNMSTRDLRTVISALRFEGYPVCGHPTSGYWIAETPDELQSTVDFLRNRAMHSLSIVSQLEKCNLAEMHGQLRLKT